MSISYRPTDLVISVMVIVGGTSERFCRLGIA